MGLGALMGGLTFQVELVEGPLSRVRFTFSVPSLDDLPESFHWRSDNGAVEGSYVRWLTGEGEQMHTTDGGPCYQWVSK